MRKFSLFLLLCGLVLCLAACGPKETTPDDDIAGDDWRTWMVPQVRQSSPAMTGAPGAPSRTPIP